MWLGRRIHAWHARIPRDEEYACMMVVTIVVVAIVFVFVDVVDVVYVVDVVVLL